MKTDYPSWVFQEQIKRTIDDFILHFVQFTKHLFQDFLKANETHQKTHQCSLHITYFFNHCWTLSRRKQSAFEKNRLFLLEQAKTQGRFKKHTHLCFKLWLVVGVFCTFFTCFILSRSNESASLPPPPGRTLHDTPKKKIKNHSSLDSLSCFCFTDTYPMGCAHLETIDLSAELARSHGFFAPSRRQNNQFHLWYFKIKDSHADI